MKNSQSEHTVKRKELVKQKPTCVTYVFDKWKLARKTAQYTSDSCIQHVTVKWDGKKSGLNRN